MELTGYCTADSYNIKSILEHLTLSHATELFRGTLYVPFSERHEAFIFPYGVIIFWGGEREEHLAFIEALRPWANEELFPYETEKYTVIEGESLKVQNDTIRLPELNKLVKMAVSHGIAQSLELGYFETVVHRSYLATRKIPEDLVKYGRISLSRKEIRRKMGEIFLERSTINLHADVLDLPEFFWEHSELEPVYQMIAGYLDIKARVEVLNHRLDIMHDLYEVLAGELNHQHSSRLELTIVWLIVIEVAFLFIHDIFNLI